MGAITVEYLNILGQKWLESKIQRMRNLLKIAEPDEALYREIMLSLGYPKNKVQFLELALLLPWKEIRKFKDKDKIEKALLYRAGFVEEIEEFPPDFDLSLKMDKSIWDFKATRPANHPDKRIKGISYLLSEASNTGLVVHFLRKIKERLNFTETPESAKSCVRHIMDFKGIGEQRKVEMFFNIILPFMFVFCENSSEVEVVEFLSKIFSIHPPLSENRITRSFRESLPNADIYSELNFSARTYFGILFYMKNQTK